MTGWVAVRPYFVPCWADLDLPSGLMGPMESRGAIVDIIVGSFVFFEMEKAAGLGLPFLDLKIAHRFWGLRGLGRVELKTLEIF